MPHALVVDGDTSTLIILCRLLERRGFTVQSACSLAEARLNLDPKPDLCLVDLRLPDGEGTALLDEGLGRKSNVVVVTRDADAEAGADALRKGARDCLIKPLHGEVLDHLLARLTRSVEKEPSATSSPLIGDSAEMQQLERTIARVAPSDATVLIVGESGTGKELIASRIHTLSARAHGPYLALNCGAVAPSLIESELFGHEKGSFTGALRQHAGYFERANGGTLFLDEVTEMPLELQVRLLRVLESRRVARVGSSHTIDVNVRVVAATNRDPEEAVRQGKLREDLLYRLQVVPLHVPPLRARGGDVRQLAVHFLAQFNRADAPPKVFSDAALADLSAYSWPGNVRELYNLVQRASIMTEGRVITRTGLELADRGGLDRTASIKVNVGDSLADVEQRLILCTVRNCRTQDEAARLLGVSPKTLYNKLRVYKAQGHSIASALDARAAAHGPTAHRVAAPEPRES